MFSQEILDPTKICNWKSSHPWLTDSVFQLFKAILTQYVYDSWLELFREFKTVIPRVIGKTPGDPFSKFYGKVGVISWILFHLIWKNYILYWDFDLKSWIVDFFTHFTWEKTPQNNFSSQNFSVENNYLHKFRCGQ